MTGVSTAGKVINYFYHISLRYLVMPAMTIILNNRKNA